MKNLLFTLFLGVGVTFAGQAQQCPVNITASSDGNEPEAEFNYRQETSNQTGSNNYFNIAGQHLRDIDGAPIGPYVVMEEENVCGEAGIYNWQTITVDENFLSDVEQRNEVNDNVQLNENKRTNNRTIFDRPTSRNNAQERSY